MQTHLIFNSIKCNIVDFQKIAAFVWLKTSGLVSSQLFGGAGWQMGACRMLGWGQWGDLSSVSCFFPVKMIDGLGADTIPQL